VRQKRPVGAAKSKHRSGNARAPFPTREKNPIPSAGYRTSIRPLRRNGVLPMPPWGSILRSKDYGRGEDIRHSPGTKRWKSLSPNTRPAPPIGPVRLSGPNMAGVMAPPGRWPEPGSSITVARHARSRTGLQPLDALGIPVGKSGSPSPASDYFPSVSAVTGTAISRPAENRNPMMDTNR